MARISCQSGRNVFKRRLARVVKRSEIASDPACAVHLPVPGVAPRHGMIEKVRSGFVFKSQAGDVRLNQMPVDQAALEQGDRLAIGPVEFNIRRASPRELTRYASDKRITRVAEGGAQAPPESAAAGPPQTDPLSASLPASPASATAPSLPGTGPVSLPAQSPATAATRQ